MNRLTRIVPIVFGLALTLLVTACGAGPTDRRLPETIEIGQPGILLLDSPARMLYVVSQDSHSLLFIDTTTRQIAATLDLGPDVGWNVELDSAGRALYFPNPGADTVSVVNLDTRQVTATIPVGDSPEEVVFDAPNHTLYVANYGWVGDESGSNEPSLSVVDTATNEAVGEIAIGVTRTEGTVSTNMGQMVLDSSANALYVRGAVLSVIDTQKRGVVSRVAIPGDSGATALDPAAKALFLANQAEGTVSVFDTTSRAIVRTIHASSPMQLILDDTRNVLYVTALDGSMAIVDTISRELIRTFPVGSLPNSGGVLDPARNALYLFQPREVSPSAGGRDTVTVLDTATHEVIETIPVGEEGPLSPEFPVLGGVVDPKTGFLYVKFLQANTAVIQVLEFG